MFYFHFIDEKMETQKSLVQNHTTNRCRSSGALRWADSWAALRPLSSTASNPDTTNWKSFHFPTPQSWMLFHLPVSKWMCFFLARHVTNPDLANSFCKSHSETCLCYVNIFTTQRGGHVLCPYMVRCTRGSTHKSVFKKSSLRTWLWHFAWRFANL